MTTELKTKAHRFMGQKMENLKTCSCQKCGTVYQIRFLKPEQNYNDFGIWFCPYCGDLTESIPVWAIARTQQLGNQYVLIALSGGLIDQVKFYEEPLLAITALSEFVKAMDTENKDAGVYGKNGLIANAKDFMDENEEFIKNPEVIKRI